MDSRISKLEKDLSDPQSHTRHAYLPTLSSLHQVNSKTQDNQQKGWSTLTPPQQKVSTEEEIEYKKKKRLDNIFYLAIGFFILTVFIALSAFFFDWSAVSSKKIDLALTGEEKLTTAVPSKVSISIKHSNREPLINTLLIVTFPPGTLNEKGEELIREERALGTISKGNTILEEIVYTPFGNNGDAVPIIAELKYNIEGSDTPFMFRKVFDARIVSSPVSLGLTLPQSVTEGEEFVIGMTVSSQSDIPFEVLRVSVVSPSDFRITSTDPLLSDNTGWNITNLEPKEKRTFTLRGKFTSTPPSGTGVIRFTVGIPNKEDALINKTLLNQVRSFPFVQAPLSLSITIPESRLQNGMVVGDSSLPVTLSWKNTSQLVISDPVIRLFIDNGEFQNDIDSKGVLSKDKKLIMWTSENLGIQSINSPSSGSVVVRLPINNLSSKDPIVLRAVLEGKKGGLPRSQLVEYKKSIVKNNSATMITTVLRRGARIQGFGPYPPLVNNETVSIAAFTIDTNRVLKKAKVRITLPEKVSFVGNHYTTQGTLTYEGNVVIWNIGSIEEEYLYMKPYLELSLAYTPESSDKNMIPVIIQSATLSEDIGGGLDGAIVTHGPILMRANDSEVRPEVREP